MLEIFFPFSIGKLDCDYEKCSICTLSDVIDTIKRAFLKQVLVPLSYNFQFYALSSNFGCINALHMTNFMKVFAIAKM